MQSGFPIVIIQGATYVRKITYLGVDGVPIDLTGYSARMMFRATLESTGSPLISLSSPSSGIVLGDVAGTIVFTISATASAALADGLTMVYDLFLTDPNGIVTALLYGQAVVQGSTIR